MLFVIESISFYSKRYISFYSKICFSSKRDIWNYLEDIILFFITHINYFYTEKNNLFSFFFILVIFCRIILNIVRNRLDRNRIRRIINFYRFFILIIQNNIIFSLFFIETFIERLWAVQNYKYK